MKAGKHGKNQGLSRLSSPHQFLSILYPYIYKYIRGLLNLGLEPSLRLCSNPYFVIANVFHPLHNFQQLQMELDIHSFRLKDTRKDTG